MIFYDSPIIVLRLAIYKSPKLVDKVFLFIIYLYKAYANTAENIIRLRSSQASVYLCSGVKSQLQLDLK
jgi:hypothetical protein